MRADTEKLFKELNKYMEANENSGKDACTLTEEFMNMIKGTDLDVFSKRGELDVYDYIDMAHAAKTKKEQIENLNKALELEPDNIDAKIMLIYAENKDSMTHMKLLKELADAEEDKMIKSGFMEENKGIFYGVIETRPFMRLLAKLRIQYISLSMLGAARKLSEHMIELCENDNLGCRYVLMAIYAYMCDEKAALKLWKKYHNAEDAQLLLSLSMLYYRMNDLEKAKDYLKSVQKVNKDTKKFIDILEKEQLDEYIYNLGYAYRMGEIEELFTYASDNIFIINDVGYEYGKWGKEVLKRQRKKKE